MKNILCYGDSNTFGFNPVDGSRYKKQERWTGVLAEILGSKYNVFEQGCNNRTMYFENPAGFEQSGCEYFEECLKKYIELEWVILALGINDTQFLYKADENTFKKGLSMLIESVRERLENTKILVLGPSIIRNNILNSFFAQMFDKTSIEKSKIICGIYKKIAQEHNCCFLDLNDIVQTSEIDGLHYDIAAHKKIALAIADIMNG